MLSTAKFKSQDKVKQDYLDQTIKAYSLRMISRTSMETLLKSALNGVATAKFRRMAVSTLKRAGIGQA